MNLQCGISPCVGCTRVADPENCENKSCNLWRSWFLTRWALLHSYPRRQMEAPRESLGVGVGGRTYAHPVQVRDYLHKDPCRGCACGADLCRTPCRARQHWARAHGEVGQ